jgi:hypothetical protein
MKYGSETTTTTLDDDGSTLSIKTNYKDGTPMPETFKTYSIRVKVSNEQQQTEEMLRFSVESAGKLDPSFHIERKVSNPTWYIVKCWTELVK